MAGAVSNKIGPWLVRLGVPGLLSTVTAFVLHSFLKGTSVMNFGPPNFAGVGLSVVGLVGLFVSLVYQRRFQRADDLIREIVVVSDRMHPDYRDLTGMLRMGWREEEGSRVDPRWREKHEQTQQTARRLREYRQLFAGIPNYVRRANAVFIALVIITVGYWLSSLVTMSTGLPFFIHLAAFGLTMECLVQLLVVLTRIIRFADPMMAETETDLAVPSWYRLMDCAVMASRGLPLASILATHELYISVESRDRSWLFSIQLPFPLYGWEWRSYVRRQGRDIVPKRGWAPVQISAFEVDRFFSNPGLWLDVTVNRVPMADLGPDEFDHVILGIEIRQLGDERVFMLEVSSTSAGGHSGWYYGLKDVNAPHSYPYFITRTPQALPLASGDVRLVMPRDPH